MSWHDCDRCGASYRSMRAALRCCEDSIICDGSGCFWCEGTTEYHPTCDSPGCNNQTHGHGSDGTTVDAYCADCKAATATDGGATCNCAHIRGICTECSPRVATDGGQDRCGHCGYPAEDWDSKYKDAGGEAIRRLSCPDCGGIIDEQRLLADGGAPMKRPESTGDEVSPVFVKALESRVDDVEDRVDHREDVAKDVVAMLTEIRERLNALEDAVDGEGGDPQ